MKQGRSILKVKFKFKEVAILDPLARGEQPDESNLDLLADFAKPASRLGLAALEAYLSELLGLKVDVVPKADVRPELKEAILKGAQYL